MLNEYTFSSLSNLVRNIREDIETSETKVPFKIKGHKSLSMRCTFKTTSQSFGLTQIKNYKIEDLIKPIELN